MFCKDMKPLREQGVKLPVRTLNTKPRFFLTLSAVVLLVFWGSILIAGTVEALVTDFEEECCSDCSSACGCVNCPPSLTSIDVAKPDLVVLPQAHPRLAPDLSPDPEQKWFKSIDHPPQNFC